MRVAAVIGALISPGILAQMYCDVPRIPLKFKVIEQVRSPALRYPSMRVDYTSYLRSSSDDGRLLWPLTDALKLGAGYLPMCDDERRLLPELVPANSRCEVQLRNLISAFNQNREGLQLPPVYERNNINYVDGKWFLQWLAHYLATSNQDGPFPVFLANCITELGSAGERPPAGYSSLYSQVEAEFRKKYESLPFSLRARLEGTLPWFDWDNHKPNERMLVAQLWDHHEANFESLEKELADYFDVDLDKLPINISLRFQMHFYPMSWCDLSIAQRHQYAQQWDYWHSPETEQERDFWWERFVKIEALEQKIAKWERLNPTTPSDLQLQEKTLTQARKTLAEVKNASKPEHLEIALRTQEKIESDSNKDDKKTITSVETPEARRERLLKRRSQLKAENNRNFNQTIANEEGISVPRVKQILAGNKSEKNPQKPRW